MMKTKKVVTVVAALIMASAGAQANSISEKEMEQFKSAHEATSEIRQDYIDQIKEAESLEKVNELETKAEDALAEVLEEYDLSVKRYNEIAVMNNLNRDN